MSQQKKDFIKKIGTRNQSQQVTGTGYQYPPFMRGGLDIIKQGQTYTLDELIRLSNQKGNVSIKISIGEALFQASPETNIPEKYIIGKPLEKKLIRMGYRNIKPTSFDLKDDKKSVANRSNDTQLFTLSPPKDIDIGNDNLQNFGTALGLKEYTYLGNMVFFAKAIVNQRRFRLNSSLGAYCQEGKGCSVTINELLWLHDNGYSFEIKQDVLDRYEQLKTFIPNFEKLDDNHKYEYATHLVRIHINPPSLEVIKAPSFKAYYCHNKTFKKLDTKLQQEIQDKMDFLHEKIGLQLGLTVTKYFSEHKPKTEQIVKNLKQKNIPSTNDHFTGMSKTSSVQEDEKEVLLLEEKTIEIESMENKKEENGKGITSIEDDKRQLLLLEKETQLLDKKPENIQEVSETQNGSCTKQHTSGINEYN